MTRILVGFGAVVSSDGRNADRIVEAVLSSIRRVKKGPGRRPQSAKRRRFMELRGRGWGISAAAREVGVSRTAANNWAFGYKVYRKGQLVGAVTPVDRLAVREISARYLSQDERIMIADLHHAGLSLRKIAAQLGRALQRCLGSCAVTGARTATGPSKLTARQRSRGRAITNDAWR